MFPPPSRKLPAVLWVIERVLFPAHLLCDGRNLAWYRLFQLEVDHVGFLVQLHDVFRQGAGSDNLPAGTAKLVDGTFAAAFLLQ